MTKLKAREDQQAVYFQRLDNNIRQHLRALLTPALIDEHRKTPLGKHSDSLERVLNYFRRPPHFGLYAQGLNTFRMIALPVAPSTMPAFIDDVIYATKSEAAHAIFLAHVTLLQAGES